MQIKNLVVDPSFFVKPEKLKIISKLEKSIAEFELVKQSESGTMYVKHRIEATMGSEPQASTSDSGSSMGYSASFSEEELSKHKPKIILPNVLKAIDPLRIRSEGMTVDQLADDYDLRDLFKHWGLKKETIRNEKSYREFIHKLKSSKLVDKFFDERRERIEWLKDPKEEDKIGENSIHYRDLQKILQSRTVSKTIMQMLKRLYGRADTCVVSCNTGFRKLTKKIGITRIKLFASGTFASGSAVKLYHFGYGLEPVEFLQTLGLAPDLIAMVVDVALITSIGFPVMGLISHSARFTSTWKDSKTKAKEEFNRRVKYDGGITELSWNLKSRHTPQFL